MLRWGRRARWEKRRAHPPRPPAPHPPRALACVRGRPGHRHAGWVVTDQAKASGDWCPFRSRPRLLVSSTAGRAAVGWGAGKTLSARPTPLRARQPHTLPARGSGQAPGHLRGARRSQRAGPLASLRGSFRSGCGGGAAGGRTRPFFREQDERHGGGALALAPLAAPPGAAAAPRPSTPPTGPTPDPRPTQCAWSLSAPPPLTLSAKAAGPPSAALAAALVVVGVPPPLSPPHRDDHRLPAKERVDW